MRRTVLTSEQMKEAHGEYLRGVSYRVLAERYECAENTLLVGFRKLGLRGGHVVHSSKVERVVRPRYAEYVRYLIHGGE